LGRGGFASLDCPDDGGGELAFAEGGGRELAAVVAEATTVCPLALSS
jgi:hypothetical protein